MTETPERRSAIGYIRTTSRRVLGEAGQRRAVQRWATNAGARVARWYVEENGASPLVDREAINRALHSLADSGSKILCVSEPEVLDAARWVQLVVEHLAVHVGGRIVYASGAATVRRRPEVGLALDAHDQMLLRLRATAAVKPERPPGPVWARTPWGYRLSRDGMRLEPCEREQAALFVVRDLRLRGFKLREIAEETKRLGIVGRTGKPLGITAIYNLLDEGEGTQRRVLTERSSERAGTDVAT